MGKICQDETNYPVAREWYLKCLGINERQGNQHGAANNYSVLGVLAGQEGNLEECGQMGYLLDSGDPKM